MFSQDSMNLSVSFSNMAVFSADFTPVSTRNQDRRKLWKKFCIFKIFLLLFYFFSVYFSKGSTGNAYCAS